MVICLGEVGFPAEVGLLPEVGPWADLLVGLLAEVGPWAEPLVVRPGDELLVGFGAELLVEP